MKIALDPFMHRHLSLEALPSKVAELGYEWIELSPRADFLEWFKAPRVFPGRLRGFKRALADALRELEVLTPSELVAQRYEKLMSYGRFKEKAA